MDTEGKKINVHTQITVHSGNLGKKITVHSILIAVHSGKLRKNNNLTYLFDSTGWKIRKKINVHTYPNRTLVLFAKTK